ncbi:uncharacterized protein PV09_02792 [Verruconis gallopava]|uniref:Heterokaryon incompatibility domain-containing protein n=1 Tax=Verruconis gallopava TaxID=253628 RepID=A0A0D2B525_9PEZI|nr:uncharacterized protein PV09_02792 [Verruconis gallopava]KIW06329.1 hypothetical protein PV09_02792 [Verruconis gallopava]
MASARTFKYERLRSDISIRLIQLYPENAMSSLNSSVSYEAISYVWEGETKQSSIVSNGGGLNITSSLVQVLKRFRTPDKARMLWADAVCINQHDISGRNQQVRRMADVRRQAQSVLIRLGDADELEDTYMAFQSLSLLLEKVSPKLSYLRQLMGKVKTPTPSANDTRNADEIRKHFDIPGPNSREFSELVKLFRRPWFSRALTFREFVSGSQHVVRERRWGDKWQRHDVFLGLSPSAVLLHRRRLVRRCPHDDGSPVDDQGTTVLDANEGFLQHPCVLSGFASWFGQQVP